jgi:hypothetical protein
MQKRTFSQQVLLLGRDSLLQGRLLVLQSPPYVCVRLSLELLPEHAECTIFVHGLLPQLLQLFLLLLSLAFHSEKQGEYERGSCTTLLDTEERRSFSSVLHVPQVWLCWPWFDFLGLILR